MALYLDGFCDRDLEGPFWDNDLTVYTDDPKLSLCFQYSVLDWAPSIWLLIALPYQLYVFSHTRSYYRFSDISRFNLLKCVLTLVLALVKLMDVFKYVSEASEDEPLHGAVIIVAPCVEFVALLIVVLNTHYEFRKGINSSGTLFMYWFFHVVVTTLQISFLSKPLPTPTLIINGTQTDIEDEPPQYLKLDSYRYATLMVSFILVVLLGFLHLFPDNDSLKYLEGTVDDERTPILQNGADGKKGKFSMSHSKDSDTKRKLSAEIYSSFILRITYWWFTGLMYRGFKRPIQVEDCCELLPQYKSNVLVTKMIDEWENQIRKAVAKQKEYCLTKTSLTAGDVNGSIHASRGIENPLFQKDNVQYSQHAEDLLTLRNLHELPQTKKKYGPSLVMAGWAVIGPLFALNGILKLIYDLLTFLQPILLNELILVIVGFNPRQWHGYVLVGAMFVVGAVRSLVLLAHYHTGMMCGLKIRTAMTGLVFRKSLMLSTSGKKDSTVGEIVNLMSIDVQRLQDALPFLNMVWTAPITAIIAIYMLYEKLGVAAFAGLGALLLMIPVNGFVASRLKKYQGLQMVNKDERIKLSTEILNGMKVLKLYGWEQAYLRVVSDIRKNEMSVIQALAILVSFLVIAITATPFLIAAVSFIVFTVISPNNILTPNLASVSLSLIEILNSSFTFLPQIVVFLVQVIVSTKRLREYLLKDEILPDAVTYSSSAPNPIQITNGTFSWGRDEQPLLKNVNLRVPDGALMAIVGTVGSGKSSLLHAMLGEMHRTTGDVTQRGRIAYVPQQAWIINATIQDNIVFGLEFNKQKYDRVVQACALEPDFKIMPNGDQTEVGERGINMSGGQKQRISVARAVYQNADIYMLDDPLSAVDSHVAKHIFEQVLGPSGLLAHKTRILVTHAVNILPKMEQIVVMKGGQIVESGGYEELLSQNGGFAEFVREFLLEEKSDDEDDVNEEKAQFRRTLMKQISVLSADDTKDSEKRSAAYRRRRPSSVKSARSEKSKKPEANKVSAETKLIQDEVSQVGGVKWDVYAAYIRALSWPLITMAGLSYLAYIGILTGTNIWLSYWSSDASGPNAVRDDSLVYLRIGVYVAFGACQVIATLIHSIGIALATSKASRVFHDTVFWRLLRSPMSFFDTTPLGRITNRISKDIDTIDLMLPMVLRQWLLTMAAVLATLILIVISNWILICLIIPIVLMFIFIQRFYIATSRQLKRVDSVLRSPIFAHFQNSLLGLSSIRAYKITDRFARISDQLVDKSQIVYYPQCISFRWLGVSLDCLTNIMILVVGMVSVALRRDGFDASLASLAVTYTTSVAAALTMAVRTLTDLETYVVSIERLKEYAELEVEAPLEEPENMFVPKEWPQTGEMEFSDYSVRYRPGLDLVLRDINCKIKPSEKVGIVGRTGAGKSSLSLALFRILEPASGSIIVDGIDIKRLGLQTLRNRVTIIPQEPVLFSGSLRRNIDPFGQYADDQIWQALECSHLKTFVQAQPAGLDFVCSEGGENLSVGQRQLLCMARAVLRRSKVLLLDEATAAVDVETDQLIQKTIRQEFKDSTILTIAHRLNTVLDYDKIMVLDQGRVKEFDSPNNLLANKNSQFYAMARDAGLTQD